MEQMFDLVSLGELLIDFTPAGISPQQNPLYEQNPGGGAANMAVAAARYGLRCAFIGKVGDDFFGHFLKETLQQVPVDTSGLILSRSHKTTLAFVKLQPNGERDFSFYRKEGADVMLQKDEVDFSLIDRARALHFSSLTMTNAWSKEATLAAAHRAKLGGKLVTYDANWRPLLWESEAQCRASMLEGLRHCDIAKLSREELCYLTGEEHTEPGAQKLLTMGPRVLLVSHGEKGSRCYWEEGRIDVPPCPARAVDGTGAGDCFFGNAVAALLQHDFSIQKIDPQLLREALTYASRAAAYCVERKGAIPAMPTPADLAQF